MATCLPACRAQTPIEMLSWKRTLWVAPAEYWAYPFHEFCWRTLLCRLPGASDISVAQHLFGVLNALPCVTSGAIIPHHRYYGAIDVRNRNKRLLLADPTQQLSTEISPTASGLQSIRIPRYSPGLFSRLPPEIIHRILVLLPSIDVCHARLSSREIAAVSSDLPPSFWESRFDPDREMGFALSQEQANRNEWKPWRQLYLMYQEAMHAPSFEGLRNRKRIWKCVGEFATTVRQMLRSTKVDQLQLPDRGDLGVQAACPQPPGLLFPFADLPIQFDDTIFGARPRMAKAFYFPKETVMFRVSNIPFDSKVYISGCQVCSQDGAMDSAVISAHQLKAYHYYQALSRR
ncbi:hypothetical protein BX600DRAFT_502978 [Xylariales sp. PMI_506]|nr:hypothetical protein BX600DRAFT_502978 [Xylariales sp. PMI_506]